MIKLKDFDIKPEATKKVIIEELSQRQDITDYIGYLTPNKYYQQEMYQELFLVVCEMDEEKLVDIYMRKKLNGYIVGVLKKMSKSTSSPFHKKIKSFNSNLPDENLIENILSDLEYCTELKHLYLTELENEIENLSHYNKGILKDYLEFGSILKVCEKYKLSRDWISQSINESKKILRTEVQKKIIAFEENKY